MSKSYTPVVELAKDAAKTNLPVLLNHIVYAVVKRGVLT